MEIPYHVAWTACQNGAPIDPDCSRITAPPDLPKPVSDKGSGFFRPESTANGLGEINLRRGLKQNAEVFTLKTNLAYLDRELGVFLVPAGLETDMASVPRYFTWLVPKTGAHLPAALIHDAFTPPEARTYLGPKIAQAQADRIFRTAMDDLGTGTIQQWLVWTAVAIATEGKEALKCARRREVGGCLRLLRLAAFLLPILVLGILATLDVLGLIADIPWMGTRSPVFELASGAIFAFAFPIALSVLLLFWRSNLGIASIILGIAIALFLHATAVIAGLLFLYAALEAFVSAIRQRGPWRAVLDALAKLGGYIIAILILVKFALWLPIDRIDQFELTWLTNLIEHVENALATAWDHGWIVLPLALIGCAIPLVQTLRSRKTRPTPTLATPNRR